MELEAEMTDNLERELRKREQFYKNLQQEILNTIELQKQL